MAGRTRIAVGGLGLAYAGFVAKSEISDFPRPDALTPFTRLALGGPGRPYLGFSPKIETEVTVGGAFRPIIRPRRRR